MALEVIGYPEITELTTLELGHTIQATAQVTEVEVLGVVTSNLVTAEPRIDVTVVEGRVTINIYSPSAIEERVEDMEVIIYDTTPPTMPGGLTLTTGIDSYNSAWINATWTSVSDSDLSYYEIGIRIDGDLKQSYYRTVTTSYKFDRLLPNTTYHVKLRSVDRLGNTLGFTAESSITTSLDETAPGSVTSLSVEAAFSNIFLTWTNPTDVDFDVVEIWRSDTNSRTAATKIAEVRTTFYGDYIGAYGITKYYWLRARDTSGNVSEWEPVSAIEGISATTAQIVTIDIATAAIINEKIANATIDMATKVQGLLPNANLAQITDPALLADAIVLEAKLATGAVTVGKIASGAVVGSKLAAETITGDKIAAGTIVGNLIAADAIAATHLAAGSVVAGKIAVNAVIAGTIAAGAVESDKIAANAIVADKIAANAVTSAKIIAGAITSDKLTTANAVITNTIQIQDAIITSAKIVSLSATKITAGTLSADVVLTAQFHTAASGARIEIDGSLAIPEFRSFNSSAVQTSAVRADGSGFFGAWDGSYYPIAWNSAGQLTIRGAYIADLSVTNLKLAGGITYDKLSVSVLSAITANLGAVTAGSVVITTGSNHIWLNDSADGSLQIGGSVKASAPFRVTAAGVLTATSGTFSGDISGASGTFTGSISSASVTATGGAIGGWILSATTIYSAASGNRVILDKGNAMLVSYAATGAQSRLINGTVVVYNTAGTITTTLSGDTITFAGGAGSIVNASTITIQPQAHLYLKTTQAGQHVYVQPTLGEILLTPLTYVLIDTTKELRFSSSDNYIRQALNVMYYDAGDSHHFYANGVEKFWVHGSGVGVSNTNFSVTTGYKIYLDAYNGNDYFYSPSNAIIYGYSGGTLKLTLAATSQLGGPNNKLTVNESTNTLTLTASYIIISSTNLSSVNGSFAVNGAYLYWHYGGTNYKVLGTAF